MSENWPEYVLCLVAVVCTVLMTCWSGVFEIENEVLAPIEVGANDEWQMLFAFVICVGCVCLALWAHTKH